MYYSTTFIIVCINICDNIFHANDIILFIRHAEICLYLSIFLLITSILMYASLSVLIYRIDTSKCLQYELIEFLISHTIQLTYMYPECCRSMLLSQMSLLAFCCLVIHVHVPDIMCNVACSDIIKGFKLYLLSGYTSNHVRSINLVCIVLIDTKILATYAYNKIILFEIMYCKSHNAKIMLMKHIKYFYRSPTSFINHSWTSAIIYFFSRI